MQKYIYGAGGHGKVVLDAMLMSGMVCAGFVDDNEDIHTLAGLNVCRLNEVQLPMYFHLAIGDCKTRELISAKLGMVAFYSVKHPSAIVSNTASVGQGVLLAAQAVVATGATIGDHSIVNHAAIVDHDCVVGNFSHIAPHATLSGAVIVGKGVLIGAGAVLLPGIIVDDYATIGAGSIVTRHVMRGETVVGNPAKTLS